MSAEQSPQASMNAEACGNIPVSPRGINTSGVNPANTSNGAPNADNASAMLVHHVLNDPSFMTIMEAVTGPRIQSLCKQMLIPKLMTMSKDHADAFVNAELVKMMQDMAISGILPGAINCQCSESRRNRVQPNDTQNTNLSFDVPGDLPELSKDKCYVCDRNFQPGDDLVQCANCEFYYHRQCVQAMEEGTPFVCVYCAYNMPREVNDRIKAIRDMANADVGNNVSVRSQPGNVPASVGRASPNLNSTMIGGNPEGGEFPGNVSAIALDQVPDLNICGGFGPVPQNPGVGEAALSQMGNVAGNISLSNNAGNLMQPNLQGAGDPTLPPMQNGCNRGGRMNEHYGCVNCGCHPDQNGQNYPPANVGPGPSNQGQNYPPANIRGFSPNQGGQNCPIANNGLGSPNQGVQNYPPANVGLGSPNQGVQNCPIANNGLGSPNQGVQNYPPANVGLGSPNQGVQNCPIANNGLGSPNQGVQNYPPANVGLGSPNQGVQNCPIANNGLGSPNQGVQNYPPANIGLGSPNQGVQNFPTANGVSGLPNQSVPQNDIRNSNRSNNVYGDLPVLYKDTCYVCGRNFQPGEDLVQCTDCRFNYHRQCVQEIEEGTPFVCVYCAYNIPKVVNDRIKAIIASGNPNVGNNVSVRSQPGNVSAAVGPGLQNNTACNGMPEGNTGNPLNVNNSFGGNNSMRNGLPEGNRSPQNDVRSGFVRDTPINPLTDLIINNPFFINTMVHRSIVSTTEPFHVHVRQAAMNHIPDELSKRFKETLPKVVQNIVSRGLVPMTRPCPCTPEAPGESLINNQARQNASINSQARQNASMNNQAQQNASIICQARQNASMNNQAQLNASMNNQAQLNASMNNQAQLNASMNNRAQLNASMNNQAQLNASMNNQAQLNASINCQARQNASMNNQAQQNTSYM